MDSFKKCNDTATQGCGKNEATRQMEKQMEHLGHQSFFLL